ncbi:hypothetical protein M426DRAFT_91606 [Hypoxylon sp. CI-4A]|nr:hypothetical protein M426DRAFT_91606 [Hypoxylon sp. CI-4A]
MERYLSLLPLSFYLNWVVPGQMILRIVKKLVGLGGRTRWMLWNKRNSLIIGVGSLSGCFLPFLQTPYAMQEAGSRQLSRRLQILSCLPGWSFNEMYYLSDHSQRPKQV